MRLRLSRVLVVLLAVASLGACDWVKELTTKKKTPLPGERIPVMIFEPELEPDPRVADLRVMLPTPQVNADWTHAGGNATHAMHHLKVPATIAEAWERSVGEGTSKNRRLLAQPIVLNGVVFAMDSEFVLAAFDAANGERLWQYNPKVPKQDEEAFGGGIAYDDGRIFMATGFGQLVAVRARDGVELWRSTLPGPSRAAPTAGGGRVFAVTIDNQTVSYDVEGGTRQWSHSGITESAGLLGGGSPALLGDTVIVPYSSGELVALRANNGRVVWSDNLTTVKRTDTLSSVAHIRGHPVIDRGVVYAVSHSGRLVAIDLRTGARAWDRGIGGSETPWVAGHFIYVVSNQGDLYCLTRLGGRVRWVKSLPKYEDPEDKEGAIKWFGPVLAGDRLLIVGSHGMVLSISPYTGEFLSRLDLADRLTVPPAIAGETVYFVTDDADLIAYR